MDAVYDPNLVVALFESSLNLAIQENQKVLDSLKHCTHPVAYCSCGCGQPYFVDPKGPDWKFRSNLTCWDEGKLYVLDIMEDWSVGSIEVVGDMPRLESIQEIEID